jgi:hypothetical protein
MADAARPPSVGVMQSDTMQVICFCQTMAGSVVRAVIVSAARVVAGFAPATSSLVGSCAESRRTPGRARS